MKKVIDWLSSNEATLVADLAKLVAIQSISTDGEHQNELTMAELTSRITRQYWPH